LLAYGGLQTFLAYGGLQTLLAYGGLQTLLAYGKHCNLGKPQNNLS